MCFEKTVNALNSEYLRTPHRVLTSFTGRGYNILSIARQLRILKIFYSCPPMPRKDRFVTMITIIMIQMCFLALSCSKSLIEDMELLQFQTKSSKEPEYNVHLSI